MPAQPGGAVDGPEHDGYSTPRCLGEQATAARGRRAGQQQLVDHQELGATASHPLEGEQFETARPGAQTGRAEQQTASGRGFQLLHRGNDPLMK